MNYYEIEKALYNVTSYADFEEFAKYNHGYTQDLFDSEVEDYYIREITCGTYNGATDTFTPWTLTNDSLFNTILSEINETDYKSIYTEKEDIERSMTYTNADWVTDFCMLYDVFTIGNQVYINDY